MKPTELILVRFFTSYGLYWTDDGQVQDFKSNYKGISFREDWPEQINYYYIPCK